jgi:hypothetical protein
MTALAVAVALAAGPAPARAALLAALPADPACASGRTNPCIAALDLVGEITAGDDEALGELLRGRDAMAAQRPSLGWTVLRVFSQGGDVTAALNLGRNIRRHGLAVVVPQSGYCYSACVFVLGGGSPRLARGVVAIHTPYFGGPRPNLTMDDMNDRLGKLLTETRRFADEMQLAPSLIDAIWTTRPEQVRRLNAAEMHGFRLEDATGPPLDPSLFTRPPATPLTGCDFRTTAKEERPACYYAILAGQPVDESSRRLVLWKSLGQGAALPDLGAPGACLVAVVAEGAAKCP